MIAVKRSRDAAPIYSTVLEKPGVFADQEGINKKGRDLVQGDLDPVRSGEAAVDFSVHVEDGIALRHVADALQIVGLRPDGIKKKNAENGDDRQPEKGELPRNADPRPAFGASPGACEELHVRKVK